MNKRDRILNNLKEMMTANAPGESGGFTSSANSKGPLAGFDPLMTYRKTKKGIIDRRSVPPGHKRWLQSVKDIINT
jgi:hypothetical protein